MAGPSPSWSYGLVGLIVVPFLEIANTVLPARAAPEAPVTPPLTTVKLTAGREGLRAEEREVDGVGGRNV